MRNGDASAHAVALSLRFAPPALAGGWARLLASHGTADAVLPIDVCSRRIVPRLRDAGYDVDYREFEGGHTVPDAIGAGAMSWFVAGR